MFFYRHLWSVLSVDCTYTCKCTHKYDAPFFTCVVEASSHFVFLQASTSQTVYTHITEDPDTYSFGSGKHDASLECHICKTVLKSRQTLNDHIQGTHLSRYRYKCTFCGLGFKWRSMLSYHKRACPALAKPGFC